MSETSVSRSEEETEELVGDEGGGGRRSFLGSSIFFCFSVSGSFLKFEGFYVFMWRNDGKSGPLVRSLWVCDSEGL